VNDTSTKVRLSTSFKNKQTDEYEQDFSGFVMFVGTGCAAKAAKLQKGARIRLGDVDVTTKYDAERKVSYTNFKVFSFEGADELDGSNCSNPTPPDEREVDGGEPENKPGSRRLPF